MTLYALQLIHGITAGHKVQVDCPKVQLMSIAFEDMGTEQGYNMNIGALPDDGDDEFKLTIL